MNVVVQEDDEVTVVQPELIVMLTRNDRTVADAALIFEQCKDCKAMFWGFKEQGLAPEQMKVLFNRMKECGKTTVLEVVEYSEKECVAGAALAAECGADILMGTMYCDSVNDLCHENGITYMPFVGKVTERPSVLAGTADAMIDEAKQYLRNGVFGFDLLGYRYVGYPTALIKRFVSGVDAPVCVAGSINSYERLNEIKAASPWAFTIGGAFFDHLFSGTHSEQINKVCSYMHADIS